MREESMMTAANRVERHRTAEEQRTQVEQDPRITTIAAALRVACEAAAGQDDDLAILFLDSRGGERRLTYPFLWQAAREVAAGFRRRGLKEGDRVVLLLPTSEEYLITLCAAI